MEPSIKEQKIQAMKNYKRRATFVYNLVLYSLTSIITCFFLSYSFWFPSLDNFLSSLPNCVSFFFNARCFFIVGNLIVLILVGELKLKQSSSSSTPDIYDEYVSRSRSSHHGYMKSLSVEEEKKEVRVCKTSNMPHEEKKKGMRKSKSEVWGEGGIIKVKGKKEEVHKSSSGEKKIGMRSSKSEIWSVSENVKREKTKGKRDQEEIHKSSVNHEEKRIGMRSSKSEVWSVSESVKKEKTKGKGEEEIHKSSVNHEEKRMGMRSSKSEVWGESEIMESKGVKEDSCKSSNMCNDEEKRRGMRNCKTAVWGESGIIKSKGKKEEFCKNSDMSYDEEKKMGMRSCKSAIWGESEIVKETRGKQVEQPYMPKEDLNKRVEAFIARVNNQRLLEAKLVDYGAA
ncbi:hypothetical protein ACS0TY_028988 [Phlomoides rotata]